MKRAPIVTLSALVAVILFPCGGAAQTHAMGAGTWQFQGGFSGTMLPQSYDVLWSALVEARAGMFLSDGLQLQAIGDVRIWPLGDQAPKAYGFTGNVLWFPSMGGHRDLYLLGGAGGFLRDPGTETQPESGFVPLLRFGLGTNIDIPGEGFLGRFHLTTEFRGDYWLEDDSRFLAGFAIGLSWFTGQGAAAPPPDAAP